jgi:hypothetical protein
MLASMILADDRDEKKPSPPIAESAAAPSAPSAYEYVGTKKCRMCHGRQYESWRELAKGHSWEALKPGVSPEVKTKAGLDVKKNYTADPQCLSCHSVGFGKLGGYAVPDPENGKTVRLAAAREGVGCEACHGPGSGFVQIMEEIYRTDRTYKPEELRAVGRHAVGSEVCMKCHNENALCMASPNGGNGVGHGGAVHKVELDDRTGYHARFPLVHREPAERKQPSAESERSPQGN